MLDEKDYPFKNSNIFDEQKLAIMSNFWNILVRIILFSAFEIARRYFCLHPNCLEKIFKLANHTIALRLLWFHLLFTIIKNESMFTNIDSMCSLQ